MKRELKILKKVKKCIEKIKAEKEQRFQEEKETTLNLLNRSWTENQIKSYNYDIMVNSDFWIGGDYTEKDIKGSILRHSSHLFSEEEYEELYNKIYPKQKIK